MCKGITKVLNFLQMRDMNLHTKFYDNSRNFNYCILSHITSMATNYQTPFKLPNINYILLFLFLKSLNILLLVIQLT